MRGAAVPFIGLIVSFVLLCNFGICDLAETESKTGEMLSRGQLPPTYADSDGDGVSDFRDIDSDNDGIPNSVEYRGNDKWFGEVNSNEPNILDGNGDEEWFGEVHFDRPHTRDADSDGIFDLTEASSADGDGVIDDFVDENKDGLAEGIDPNRGDVSLSRPLPDTDGDGTPDYLDLDSDGDGIFDLTEAGGTDADGNGVIDDFVDENKDGLADSIDPKQGGMPLPIPDTDEDDIPDYRDLDSDGDGILDSIEMDVDTDGDGTPDHLDLDSDGDGIPDSTEMDVDTDEDGTPDYLDLDSDGDTIPDSAEAGPDPNNPVDTDRDGFPDYIDPDSDDDGLNDTREAWWLCSRTDPDTNGDHINDSASIDPDNPDRTYPYRSEDISRDNDVDGDGLPNQAEIYDVGTDFKVFSTDGDPYGDGQEYFHVNMPEISPADHPLVAAYPCLKVRLERTQITPIAEITSTTGGSKGSEWSVTHETSFEDKEHHEGGVDICIATEVGTEGSKVSGSATFHYMGFHEKTSTTTTSKTESGFTNEDWSTATTTSLDEAAKLAFTLNVKNIGTTPAENVVPNVNIKLGNKEIATITSPTVVTSLDIEETSANFVVDQGMVGTRGEDIIASFEQLKTIDCGTPLDIETFHVDAKVKRWDGEKNEWVCIEEDFSTYMREIDEKTATIMFSLEDEVYKEYKVYAGSVVTLGDAINWTVGRDDSVSVQNNTEWELGFSDIDIRERIIELNDSNRSIFELELESGWYFILRQPRSEKPKIAWAGYNSDMTKVSASVTDERGIKSVIAHVMVEGKYQDLSMTDADNNTIYEASTTQAMERDENATITATNVNDSTSQLKIGTLRGSVEAPFSDGWYVINVKSSGFYLDGSDKEHDYNARQCRGSLDPKQRWYLEHIGHGYYTIRNNASWLYLEVDHGKESRGANVQSGILEFDENLCPKMSQQWYFERVEDGYYEISPRNSDKRMSIELRGQIEDGRSVILEDYNISYNQEKWMVVPLECYPSAIWYDPNCYVDDNYVFEAKHSSKYLSNRSGGSVVQYSVLTNWTLEPIGDGYFKINNSEGGCLATSDPNDTGNGVNAIICDCNGNENQMWRFEPTADGCYKIVSKYSEKCLEVTNGRTANNVTVQQFDYRGQDHQMWRVINRDRSGLVTLYDAKKLQGNFRCFMENTSDLRDFNNRASSLEVAPGYAVILYDSPNYLGRSKIFIGDIDEDFSNFIGNDFNDSTSSLQIVKIDELGAVRIMRKDLIHGERRYLFGDGGLDDKVYMTSYDVSQDQLWKLEPADEETYRIVSVGSENDSERCVLFANQADPDEADLRWRVDAMTDDKCRWYFKNNGGYYLIVDDEIGRSLRGLVSFDVIAESRSGDPGAYGWILTR